MASGKGYGFGDDRNEPLAEGFIPSLSNTMEVDHASTSFLFYEGEALRHHRKETAYWNLY